MLEIALECAARGWYVFPCHPGSKKPATRNGYKDASNDEQTIRAWWVDNPDCNVGIATGASRLTVLDVDHGIDDVEWARLFVAGSGGRTYTVRTGRRPGFGLQLYFLGGDQVSIPWMDGDYSGDIRSATGYVMAAGSLHPSGERYEVFNDAPMVPTPAWVAALKRPERKTQDGKLAPIGPGEGQHDEMAREAGRLRGVGCDAGQILAGLITWNDLVNSPPLPLSDLESIADGFMRYPAGERTPEVVIGKPKESEPDTPVDWRTRYHTFEEIRDAPPITFLIEGFLTEDAITAIAAPVGQRKTLIVMNVVRSLLTGAKLFDYFAVVKRPERVIYLCPEMGIQSFSQRMKNMGLLDYVGKTLFCQTMTSENPLALADLTDEELTGSVVILDTAIRFLKGDENSSEAMQLFAKSVFRLQRSGSLAVVLLHHSSKGTKESEDLTLENCMRGSGELGAFLACCWATRLQDPDDAYGSPSFLKNVKQRDFESNPFEIMSDRKTGILTRITPDGESAKLKTKTTGDRDGKQADALEFVLSHPELSTREASAALLEMGIKRGAKWIALKRREASGNSRGNSGNSPSGALVLASA